MGEEQAEGELREIIDEMRALIHEIAETFAPLLQNIYNHYKQKITYAPVDLAVFQEDLKSECLVGLWKALVRFDIDKMRGSPPEAYISKVIRSHVKEIPIGYLHIARIPQSKWMKLSNEAKETLRYTQPNHNNNLTCEDEIVEDEFDVYTEFDTDDIEWRDYFEKLPPLFKEGVLVASGEKQSYLPLPIAKFLAVIAIVAYKEGG